MTAFFRTVNSEHPRIESAIDDIGTAVKAFYSTQRNNAELVFRVNKSYDAHFTYYKLSFTGVPRTAMLRYSRRGQKLDMFLKQSMFIDSNHLVFPPETKHSFTYTIRPGVGPFAEVIRLVRQWFEPMEGDDLLVNQPLVPAVAFNSRPLADNEVMTALIKRAAFTSRAGASKVQIILDTKEAEKEVVHELDPVEHPSIDFGKLSGKWFVMNRQNDFAILDPVRYKRHFTEVI